MLDKIFELKQNKTTIKTEIIAGITTFLSVSYIMFVNPQILSEAGMNYEAAFIATIITSALASLLAGLIANLPFALAPGMGINAFFAYTVCLTLGFKWQEALFAVFMSAILFLIISLTSLRQKIMVAIPETLKSAIGVAIGFFITFVGLINSQIIVGDPATLVKLGNLHDPLIILTIISIFIGIVFALKNKSLGLFYTMIIAIIMCLITQFVLHIDLGLKPLTGIVSKPPSISPILFKLFDVNIMQLFSNFNFWVVVFSFLFMGFFDTTGMLISVGKKANLTQADGTIRNERKIMCVDAFSSVIGSLLGCSPIACFLESLSGIAVGGKTGLSAVVVSICFLLSIFFFPIISFLGAIMNVITTPALVIVGIMMISHISEIDFSNIKNSAATFITIVVSIGAYSISEGIAAGVITYVICSIFNNEAKQIPKLMYLIALFFIIHYIVS